MIAVQFISKLGQRERSYFREKFRKLESERQGYRRLYKQKNVELWELRCSSHRIYYTVENEFIVVEDIQYEGDIQVIEASNKNSQQRTINKLVSKISRSFSGRSDKQ